MSAPPLDMEALAQKLEELRVTLFNAMGVVSVIGHSVPQDVKVNEPDIPRACEAAYSLLGEVAGALEPETLLDTVADLARTAGPSDVPQVMSGGIPIKPAQPERPGRLTPQEAQTLLRRARAAVHGARVCIDHQEEVSAYTMELVEELLNRVDDGLDLLGREPKHSDDADGAT
jgi:hypothetical protein